MNDVWMKHVRVLWDLVLRDDGFYTWCMTDHMLWLGCMCKRRNTRNATVEDILGYLEDNL